MSDPLLIVANLAVSYDGAVQALRGVSIRVHAGSIVAVLGSNGAGKSTLLRAVSRSLGTVGGKVTAGTLHYDGTDLARMDAAAAVRAGLVQIPEGRQVFADLTVEENLRAGGYTVRDPAVRRRAHERVLELFPILGERRHQRSGLLSGGQQQMLAIGRALMTSPRLLLLDEPSLGLAPQLVEQIGEIIKHINAQGTAVLLVEQNAVMGLRVADTAYVLETGQMTASGPADKLAQTDEVRNRYLGVSEPGPGADDEAVRHEATSPRAASPRAAAPPPALSTPVTTPSGRVRSADGESAPRSDRRLLVDALTVRFGGVTALNEVSFTVEPGTIHALIGPNGAGKSTCINVLGGAYRATSGTVHYGERELGALWAHEIADLGVSRTFQNISLSLEASAEDNILVGRHRIMRSGVIAGSLRLPRARREESEHRDVVREIADLLGIRQLLHREVHTLSYGDRKRVEMGRALAAEPSLLLLDEPVAGMNHGESTDLAAVIASVQRRLGLSILLVEHDMPFVMSLAESITVLDFGRRIAEGTPHDVQRDPEVLRAFLGAAEVSS